MKLSTFENRTRGINKNSKGHQLAKQLLTTGEVIRPCWTSGRGRYTSNQDYTFDVRFVLQNAGLKCDHAESDDFIIGNDAPKGGKTGNYIKLTAKGRRKMIKA